MPCRDFDQLEQRVKDAFLADTRAVMADVNTRRSMSTAKYLQWKDEARRALKQAEDAQEQHIDGCPMCLAEGRKTLRTSDISD